MSAGTAAFALGFIALVSQTIVLREFLAVLGGNELIIGMTLAGWMLLTALGAYAGRAAAAGPRAGVLLFWASVLIAVLPLGTIFLAHAGRNALFPYGSAIGPWEGFAAGMLVLAPLCLVSGSLFTVAAALLPGSPEGKGVTMTYALEAAGSAAGGILYGTVGIQALSTYQALLALAFGGLVAAGLVGRQTASGPTRFVPAVLLALLAFTVARIDLDRVARGYLFPGQEILLSRDTPHGNLTVTRQGGQRNIFENGLLFFSTDDVVPAEEAVHYAMVQHPRPRSVLLIGGGVAGSTREILKYGVARVDYAEVNPALLDLGREMTTALDDPTINAVPVDGRLFVKGAEGRYDVALVNVPEPLTAQLSRYYTVEFMRELKRVLADGAVVQFSLFAAAEYRGREARSVGSILAATLRAAFRNVLIVPGMRDFYLASDSSLTLSIAAEIARRGIPTVYVNGDYLDDRLLRERSADLERGLDPGAPLATDMAPVAYLRSVEYWLSGFGTAAWIPGVALLALLLAAVSRANAVSLGMLTGGFAASSLELVLLFGFQVVYGVVYQAIGVLIALFMAGLALGARLAGAWRHGRRITAFVALQAGLSLAALSLAAGLPLVAPHAENRALLGAFFGGGMLLLGAIVGGEFALASALQRGASPDVAGRLYGADLLGSAAGALIVAAYVIPLWGIGGACLVACGVTAASAVVAYLRRKQFSESTGGT